MGKTFITFFGFLMISGSLLATSEISREISTTWYPTPPESHRVTFTSATAIIPLPVEEVGHLLVEDIDRWNEKIPRLSYSKIIPAEKAKVILEQSRSRDLSFEQVMEIVGKLGPLEQRLYRGDSGRISFYILQYIDYPWPVGNKWLLFQMEKIVQSEGIRVSFLKIAGQFEKVDGVWEVQPLKQNPLYSRATYSFVSDAGFQAPHFIGKMICTGQATVVVEKLREAAESMTPHITSSP